MMQNTNCCFDKSATLMRDACKKRTNTIIMITNQKVNRITRGSVMMMVIRVQTPRNLERRRRVLSRSIRTRA